MASWSFLTNHGLVLTYIGRYPDSTGLEIAQAVGITERAARKIVADLLAESYIEREKVGRRNRYRLNTHLPLRHPAERTATVGELLGLLWREEDAQAAPQDKVPAAARGANNGTSNRTARPRLQPRQARRTIRV
ncbi:MAG: helix-turn-helix transcriptional regulator [Chloroflexota bacterium]